MNIPVIYEDDFILIADKPSGLLTVPTPKNEKRTLTGILGLFPCHRLDRGTSGLIIYAKNRQAEEKMAQAFRSRAVRKTYVAFVNKVPLRMEAEITRAIEGKPAKTHYKVIEKRRYFAIVEVRPLTGRTNQIRIHFKSIGNPVLGEDKYAFRRDFEIKAKRLMLHACALEFEHPFTGKTVKVKSDIPEDMQDFLNKHPD